jgi:hypothetical protein
MVPSAVKPFPITLSLPMILGTFFLLVIYALHATYVA